MLNIKYAIQWFFSELFRKLFVIKYMCCLLLKSIDLCLTSIYLTPILI